MFNPLQKISNLGIIPVVSLEKSQDGGLLAEVLLDVGINCIEITFRTSCAEEAIKIISSEYKELLVGAGSIRSRENAIKAVECGAQFIISPGIDEELVRWCQANSVSFAPGVITPSEVMLALNLGVDIVKLFPAEEVGGINYLKAISAPFPTVRFIPTGGINQFNLAKYLSMKSVIACGGSWFVRTSLISSGDFGKIRDLAKEALDIVRGVRERELK